MVMEHRQLLMMLCAMSAACKRRRKQASRKAWRRKSLALQTTDSPDQGFGSFEEEAREHGRRARPSSPSLRQRNTAPIDDHSEVSRKKRRTQGVMWQRLHDKPCSCFFLCVWVWVCTRATV